jgi:HD-GYP domain-containing protein (c-di-GMP phosphodiesterase class II)
MSTFKIVTRKAEKTPQSGSKEIEIYQARQKMRASALWRADSFIEVQPLVAIITHITRQALNASASSLILSEEKGKKLIFSFADGPLGQQIRRLKISKQSGIAGWVARNGKPLIVNDVNQNKYFNKFADKITGYKTKSIICAPLFIHHKTMGVIEVLNQLDGDDFNERDLQILTVVATTVAQIIENFMQTQNRLVLHKNAIDALVSAVDAKDTCMRGHSKRVSRYALIAANALSLSKEERRNIGYAAILHDIGKLGFRDSMLSKSDTLTDKEREIIRKHPVIGDNLLKGVAFFTEAGKMILYHHERYDGKGYPLGLKEDAIPVGARILAVADAFDNMITGKSCRAALSEKEAFIELNRCAGSQFDPAVVKAFYSGLVSPPLSGNI